MMMIPVLWMPFVLQSVVVAPVWNYLRAVGQGSISQFASEQGQLLTFYEHGLTKLELSSS